MFHMGAQLGLNRSIEKIAEFLRLRLASPGRMSSGTTILIRYPLTRDTHRVCVHRWCRPGQKPTQRTRDNAGRCLSRMRETGKLARPVLRGPGRSQDVPGHPTLGSNILHVLPRTSANPCDPFSAEAAPVCIHCPLIGTSFDQGLNAEELLWGVIQWLEHAAIGM
jgi:hypothetical protein